MFLGISESVRRSLLFLYYLLYLLLQNLPLLCGPLIYRVYVLSERHSVCQLNALRPWSALEREETLLVLYFLSLPAVQSETVNIGKFIGTSVSLVVTVQPIHEPPEKSKAEHEVFYITSYFAVLGFGFN